MGWDLVISSLLIFVSFVLGLVTGIKISNIQNKKRRENHKLASTQRNIGNRIYHEIWDAADQNSACLGGLQLKKLEKPDYKIVLSTFQGGWPILEVRVNILEEIPITVTFYDTGFFVEKLILQTTISKT